MSKTTTATTRKTSARKPTVKAASKPTARRVSKATKPKVAAPKAAVSKAAATKAAATKAATPKVRTKDRKASEAGITAPVAAKKAASGIQQALPNIETSTNQFIESGEKIMNDQVKQFTDLQTRSLEPMRAFSAFAADAMEQVVRKNYAVMGDLVEFSVKQAQLPAQTDDFAAVAQAKLAETTAFTELLSSRANEYVEMSNQFGQKAREVTEEAVASVKAA